MQPILNANQSSFFGWLVMLPLAAFFLFPHSAPWLIFLALWPCSQKCLAQSPVCPPCLLMAKCVALSGFQWWISSRCLWLCPVLHLPISHCNWRNLPVLAWSIIHNSCYSWRPERGNRKANSGNINGDPKKKKERSEFGVSPKRLIHSAILRLANLIWWGSPINVEKIMFCFTDGKNILPRCNTLCTVKKTPTCSMDLGVADHASGVEYTFLSPAHWWAKFRQSDLPIMIRWSDIVGSSDVLKLRSKIVGLSL
jgi:hypothetical protein